MSAAMRLALVATLAAAPNPRAAARSQELAPNPTGSHSYQALAEFVRDVRWENYVRWGNSAPGDESTVHSVRVDAETLAPVRDDLGVHAPSFRHCPEFEPAVRALRVAGSGDMVEEILKKGMNRRSGPWPNPSKHAVPNKTVDYVARKWVDSPAGVRCGPPGADPAPPFRVGGRVEVYFADEDVWYAGNVSRADPAADFAAFEAATRRGDPRPDAVKRAADYWAEHETGHLYDVAYDDGDFEEAIPAHIVRATRQGRPPRSPSEAFSTDPGCATENYAVEQLETTGFVAFTDLIPRADVAYMRDLAERKWCDVARAFAARNLTHCLAWGLRDRHDAYREKAACPDITKNSYQHTNELHWPYVQLVQELAHGNDDPRFEAILRRALARLFPALHRINDAWHLQERGFSMNQARFGGQWHVDGGEEFSRTFYCIFFAVQDVTPANGGTAYLPWGAEGVVAPSLPAGSVVVFDQMGVVHRVGDHAGPPAGAPETMRWLAFQGLYSGPHEGDNPSVSQTDGVGSAFDDASYGIKTDPKLRRTDYL